MPPPGGRSRTRNYRSTRFKEGQSRGKRHDAIVQPVATGQPGQRAGPGRQVRGPGLVDGGRPGQPRLVQGPGQGPGGRHRPRRHRGTHRNPGSRGRRRDRCTHDPERSRRSCCRAATASCATPRATSRVHRSATPARSAETSARTHGAGITVRACSAIEPAATCVMRIPPRA